MSYQQYDRKTVCSQCIQPVRRHVNATGMISRVCAVSAYYDTLALLACSKPHVHTQCQCQWGFAKCSRTYLCALCRSGSCFSRSLKQCAHMHA